MSLAPEIKIAEQRLSVLELAKALGNVSAACRTFVGSLFVMTVFSITTWALSTWVV